MRIQGTVLAIGLSAAAALSGAGEAPTAEVEIDLRDEVVLEGRTFTLGEIAELDGSDSVLVSRLERVLLGRTPRAGRSAHISRDAVIARIERLLPGVSGHVAWSGPTRTKVQASYRSFDRHGYLAAARQRLHEWLGKYYDEFSARPAGRYEDLRLPDGKVTMRTTIVTQDRARKRMCVWVDLLLDDAHYSSLPVWFEVSAEGAVYELRRPLSSATALKPEMLIRTRRDLAAINGVPVTELANIEGLRLARDLPGGAVLVESALQPIPDVVKGRKLRVEARVGKVTLFATARALEDGNRGDPIRVERLDGSDSYMARVLDTDMAIVEEDYR